MWPLQGVRTRTCAAKHQLTNSYLPPNLPTGRETTDRVVHAPPGCRVSGPAAALQYMDALKDPVDTTLSSNIIWLCCHSLAW